MSTTGRRTRIPYLSATGPLRRYAGAQNPRASTRATACLGRDVPLSRAPALRVWCHPRYLGAPRHTLPQPRRPEGAVTRGARSSLAVCEGQGSRCGWAETHELGEELRRSNTRHSVSTRKFGRAPIPHHTPAVTRRVLRTLGGALWLAASLPQCPAATGACLHSSARQSSAWPALLAL